MKFACLILIFANLSILEFAHARLGDNESNAVSHIRTQAPKYTTREVVNELNTVTEYVDTNDVVFAVTWHGVVQPDLQDLFGSYYTEYKAVNATRPRARTRTVAQIKTSRIVVIKHGHMRDVRGKAFLPNRVPVGVNVEDLP